MSARLDGALWGRDLASCTAHLAQCEACRAYGAELDSLGSRLDGWLPADPDAGFAGRVLAAMGPRLAQRPAWRERLAWLRPAPVGLAAAAFVLGVLLSSSMEGGGVRPAERVETVASTGEDAFDPLPTDSAAARLLVLLGHGEE